MIKTKKLDIEVIGLTTDGEEILKLIEKTKVFSPNLAAARPASHPACPAPITATSNFPASYSIFYISLSIIIFLFTPIFY